LVGKRPGLEEKVMKRNQFIWSVLVVLSLFLMVSATYAARLTIRGIPGPSYDAVSAHTPTAEFAIDRSYNMLQPSSTDEVIGNSAIDTAMLLPPAVVQILNALPSSRNLVIVIVADPIGDSGQAKTTGAVVPVVLPQPANGFPKDDAPLQISHARGPVK
jgi:hypothetical protein